MFLCRSCPLMKVQRKTVRPIQRADKPLIYVYRDFWLDLYCQFSPSNMRTALRVVMATIHISVERFNNTGEWSLSAATTASSGAYVPGLTGTTIVLVVFEPGVADTRNNNACCTTDSCKKQVAQLSQRDRATVWVSCGQNMNIVRATPTLVGEAFIFYP